MLFKVILSLFREIIISNQLNLFQKANIFELFFYPSPKSGVVTLPSSGKKNKISKICHLLLIFVDICGNYQFQIKSLYYISNFITYCQNFEKINDVEIVYATKW